MVVSRSRAVLKNVAWLTCGALIALLIVYLRRDPQATAAPNITTGKVEIANQSNRAGYDPLSLAEIEQAQKLALTEWQAKRGKFVENKAVPADAQLEVVKTERHEEIQAVYDKGSWQRRADVLIFDYAKNSLVAVLVNLSTGKVDALEQARGSQPHPTDRETARALQLVLDHPTFGPQLRGEYQALTKKSLTTASQLRAAGFVYIAEPQVDNAAVLRSCQQNRCVQLLLSADNEWAVSSTPIVDLSNGLVVSLNR